MLWDTPYGALTQLWAGTSPEGAELNGKVSYRYCSTVPIFFVNLLS